MDAIANEEPEANVDSADKINRSIYFSRADLATVRGGGDEVGGKNIGDGAGGGAGMGQEEARGEPAECGVLSYVVDPIDGSHGALAVQLRDELAYHLEFNSALQERERERERELEQARAQVASLTAQVHELVNSSSFADAGRRSDEFGTVKPPDTHTHILSPSLSLRSHKSTADEGPR